MNNYHRLVVIFFLAITVPMSKVEAATINIYEDGSGDFPTIQAAIDDPGTNNGDIIIVHDGTYYENIDFKGKAITIKTNEGATIDGSNPSDPQKGSVVTFESGEGSGSVLEGFKLTNGSGNAFIKGAISYGPHGGGIFLNNSSSPLITNCIISSNSMDGAGCGIACLENSHPTITNCLIKSNKIPFRGYHGSGIYCDNSSPIISNSTITANSANGPGGGIYCIGNSSPSIENCTISNNLSRYGLGGGIYCYGTAVPPGAPPPVSPSPQIINCTITGNHTSGYGGGIACDYSSPTITNCIISGNEAGSNGKGGGIWCAYTSAMITNSVISDNLALFDGGGIACEDNSSVRIMNCTISGNTAFEGGGGISCKDFSSPSIVNCSITGNTAWRYGGGIHCEVNSSPIIVHCTISSNSATHDGGGIYVYSTSSPTVINTILWGDIAGQNGNEIFIDDANSSIDINYSDIQGGWGDPEDHNIDEDPLFIDPTNGDYHLKSNSPCIDMGTNNTVLYPTLPDNDIDGDFRPLGAGYDMGADEYVAHNVKIEKIEAKKKIRNCANSYKIMVLLKNKTKAKETAQVYLYKDDILVKEWNTVKLRKRQAMPLLYNYNPAGDDGSTVSWTAEVIIFVDDNPSDNTFGPKKTKVHCAHHVKKN